MKTPRPKRDRSRRRFNLRAADRHPLLPLSAASAVLDKSRPEVLALIEEGKLPWAFDIRTAKSRRREIRILRRSLFEFAGSCARSPAPREESGELSTVLKLILPAGEVNFVAPAPGELAEPAFPGTVVQRCFSCRSDHIGHLIRDNLLREIQHRHRSKATPLLTRASLVAFLKARKIS